MRLGKRPPPRLQLPRHDSSNSTPHGDANPDPASPDLSVPSPQPAAKRLRNASPPVNGGRNASAEREPPACLSPTLLGPLGRAKQLSESEEHQPPPSEVASGRERVGDYVLLGKADGNTLHALHVPTNTLRSCQVLSAKELGHVLRVRQRLNDGEKGSETGEAILPSAVTFLPHTNGRYLLFAPHSYGSLHGYVQSRRKLSEETARGLFRQIVEMVDYAHSLGIVVRDLKLRQFVFADQAQTRLRMGSVSQVLVLADPASDEVRDRHGCPAYVSPEILDLAQPSHSGKAADMWSLGVLLFVMLLGRYPFYDQTPTGLFGKIRHGTFWIPKEEGLTLEVRLILRGLLRREASERPAAELLLALPWLRPNAYPPKPPHKAPAGNAEDDQETCCRGQRTC